MAIFSKLLWQMHGYRPGIGTDFMRLGANIPKDVVDALFIAVKNIHPWESSVWEEERREENPTGPDPYYLLFYPYKEKEPHYLISLYNEEVRLIVDSILIARYTLWGERIPASWIGDALVKFTLFDQELISKVDARIRRSLGPLSVDFIKTLEE